MPEIVIFHEPLIVGTCNKCHWIWHTSNPKYAPLKELQSIFPVKIKKMWYFCLILWFFEEPLITETWNLWHWIWHASNPTYVLLKPFQSIFSSQNQQMWNFGCFLNSPWQKTEKKNINFHKEKVFTKTCKSAHIGFGYANCNALCYNFVWHVLFELLWFFCICYGKVKI